MLQKLDNLKDNKWRYALVLPILLFGMHSFAFNTYYVIAVPTNQQVEIIDTIPYQIDTITIFDYHTYEKTVKYEKFVMDTVVNFNTDTYVETVKVERRVIEEGPIVDDIQSDSDKVGDQCYIMFWNDKSLSSKRQWTVELVKESLQEEINIASIYTDNCERVKSWSARVIVVPVAKDPHVQLLSETDNKVSEKLLNDGYLVPGTKLFFQNVTVNGKEEKNLMSVITIE